MFSAAMVTQPMSYSDQQAPSASGGKGKKKKKAKGTLLFATGAQRKY